MSQGTIPVLALCGMLTALQFTLVIPLLPALPQMLSVSADGVSWVVTSTLLTSAIATPIVSRMADMYGKRRMLVLALAVMTAGSIVAAVDASFPALIVGRAMQGFASSMIPVGISILRDQLPKDRVGSAVALMSATLGIGSALGLPLSGVLFEAFGWQSLFWFTAIAGCVFIGAVYFVVPESTLRVPGRFDVAGAILLSIVLTAVLLVISRGGAWGWDSTPVVGLLSLAVVATAIWIPTQLRINHPMVDLRTAVRRPVLLTNLASVFAGFVMFMNMLITTQQLHAPLYTGYGFELTVAAAGLAMVPSGLAMIIMAPFSGRLLNRWGGRPVLIVGSAIMSVTYAWRVYSGGSLLEVVVGSTFVGVGTAMAFAAMPTLIMGAVPIAQTASANGLNSLLRALGASTCSAVVALVLSDTTAPVNGVSHPTEAAIHLCLWLAAGSAALAATISAFIPNEGRIAARKSGKGEPNRQETLIHGRILLANNGSRNQPAVVTVLNLDGTQVDWTRADHDGRYAAFLPGPGRYLVIANAGGWVPRAQVIDIVSGDTEKDLTLEDQLALSGVVSYDGVPAGGAAVVMSKAEGGFIASDRCDDGGRYCIQLPPPGYYFITAVDLDGAWAHTAKLNLSVKSEILNMEVHPGPTRLDQS